MPKFVKQILTEGDYLVSTASGGRKKRSFTPNELTEYAETAGKMLESGLKIPAPRQHTLDARPELQESDPGKGYENLGFWEKFYVSNDDQGNVALFGVLDAPGDRENTQTPAGMIAKTVKDVSICLHDFVDGKGREWKDAIWHIALPTHPIEPGQSNFTPLPDDYDVVMMSQRVMTMDLGKLLTALSKCGISLPSDTTMESLLDRLYVAVTQKSEGSGSDGLDRKPSGTKVETYPIMMALTQAQVDAIIAAGVVNPATGKPFDKASLVDDGNPSETEQMKKSVVLMSNLLNKSYKERYADRVRSLVSSGRVTEDYATSKLMPLVESLDVRQAIQMGLSESGELPSNAVEVTLSALESLPPKNSGDGSDKGSDNLWMSSRPGSGSTPPKPDHVADLSNEDAQKLVEMLLKA